MGIRGSRVLEGLFFAVIICIMIFIFDFLKHIMVQNNAIYQDTKTGVGSHYKTHYFRGK